MNWDLSVFPSFHSSVQKFSWNWLVSFFSETHHGVRGLCGFLQGSARFFKKKYFVPKMEKMGLKIGFFEFIGKFSLEFFLHLVYKESSYYLLYSCTNPILGEIQVSEIWAKMLSANQIAGFLNRLYLQNAKMKKPDFLHVETD